jgi:hypothetical protein
VAGLEVLQVVAADRGRAAHHRADHDRRDRADRRVLRPQAA